MNAPFAQQKKGQGEEFPAELKELSEDIAEEILKQEKPTYKNPLVPFATHEGQVKEQIAQALLKEHKEINAAQETLEKVFAQQEKEGKIFPEDASYLTWQWAKVKMRKAFEKEEESTSSQRSMQERFEIPWAFMDRCFDIAHELKQKGDFVQARNIFKFLIFLNPLVFDYIVSLATCLYFMEKWEESLRTYLTSLLIRSEDAFVFFQMANCFYKLKDDQNAKAYIDECITRCSQEEHAQEILQEAIKLKEFLKSQKSA